MHSEYPKWVTPNRAAWLAAQTPDERRAAKVLVEDEAAHRLAAPADFAPVEAEDEPDTNAPVVRRGPGRPRKVVSETD